MALFGFFEPIIRIFSNPIVLISMFALGASIIILFVINESLKRGYEVYYFSEAERLLEPKKVSQMSPKQLKTKDNYRFIRNSVAYTLKRGAKTIVVWLAKRGTAYTWKPQHNKRIDKPVYDEDGKQKHDEDGNPLFETETVYQRVGTLLDGLRSAIGEELVKDLEPDVYEKLVKSEIFVTVDIEEGTTPDGLPPMSEKDIYQEANGDMAELIGHRIRNALAQIDWIEKIALMGSGGLAIVILQGLGILPSFAPTNALMAALLVVI